jgi:hypothetical protein
MEIQVIQNKIYEIRGVRVMLDRDLAELYRVTTGNLNKAVKRNIERFPERFMFQLTADEFLKFQNGISSWGGNRSMPYAFTEQGVSMLSAILRSPVAIQVSISIMDAFVAMRNYITYTATITSELSEIRAKLELLERNDEVLAQNDELIARDGQETLRSLNDLSEDIRKDIDNLYAAIGELSIKPAQVERPRRRIGFNQNSD